MRECPVDALCKMAYSVEELNLIQFNSIPHMRGLDWIKLTQDRDQCRTLIAGDVLIESPRKAFHYSVCRKERLIAFSIFLSVINFSSLFPTYVLFVMYNLFTNSVPFSLAVIDKWLNNAFQTANIFAPT
jgi:hypothetical protein